MQRFRVWGTLGLAFWLAGWSVVSTVHAAQPADGVPDSASLVVRWKAPRTTADKLADFVDAVQPGFGGFVKAGLPAAGDPIGIPGLGGVDLSQDIWLIVFAESGGEPPSVVFMVTAKDVEALKDALDDKYESHTADKLVIYSEDEEALGKVRDQLKSKDSALFSKIDVASKKLLDTSDLSLLVNVRQLTEEFEDELKEAEPQIDAFLDQISNAIPDAQRDQLAPVFEMYGELAKASLQCARDSNSVALGITFSKAAIRYESRLQVTEKSAMAGFLAKQSPAALGLLGRLPANQAIYFGVKADMAGLIDWSMKLTKGMMKLSDEDSAKMDEAVKELGKLKYDEMAGYLNINSAAPAFRSGSVMQVTPTKRMRELSHTMLKAMSKVELPGMTQTTTLEPGAEKIGGVEVDRITIKQEADGSNDPLGIQEKIQKILFGDDGMQQLAMYQPNRVLQIMGGGKTELQSLITTLDATPSTGSAVAAARQKLAEKANLVALIDLARLIINGAKLAASDGGLPIDVSALEALKLDPSFIGVSVTCEPTAVRSQLEIPVAQAQNIAKIIAPLVKAAQ